VRSVDVMSPLKFVVLLITSVVLAVKLPFATQQNVMLTPLTPVSPGPSPMNSLADTLPLMLTSPAVVTLGA